MEATDTPKFPHLENLDRAQRVMDVDEVWVTEKLDGFNARIGKTAAGEPWFGSRNEVGSSAGNAAYAAFAQELAPRLADGLTLYGEWAGTGVQRRIDYGPQRFWLFNAKLDGRWLHPGVVQALGQEYGLSVVPTLHVGRPNLALFAELRVSASRVAAGAKVEGIVITPWPPITDAHGGSTIAKYKNPDFEERASARRERVFRDFTGVEPFIEEYVTDERLGHVLQQVSEGFEYHELGEDLDPLDPRHTGAVLRAMYEDVVREGADDYEQLSGDDKKLVGKACATAAKALLAARREGSLE